MANTRFLFFSFLATLLCSLTACNRPSRADQMRQEMYRQDSLQYVQARLTRAHSDSLLQTLLPQVDPLLKSFRYEKEEGYEDHGRYVHRLLTTDRNTSRNYLQAYVTDDARLTLQSYYYGSKPLRQHAVRLAVGENYVEAEGTNHAFEAEGTHEILTIPQTDALRLMALVAANSEERIRVTLIGSREQVYYLQSNEKQALADTYRLALLMQDIATLERTIRTADLQIEKQQRKHAFR